MRAAISRMMRVTSCRASHTSCRKVFGFFGGIRFLPYSSFLLSRSVWTPARPEGVGEWAEEEEEESALGHVITGQQKIKMQQPKKKKESINYCTAKLNILILTSSSKLSSFLPPLLFFLTFTLSADHLHLPH